MSKRAIRCDSIHKSYPVASHPLKKLLAYTFPRIFLSRIPQFIALEDISFSLPPGKVLGLIGLNGAGKSTLLQIIAGVLAPTSGHVQRRGRVAALLELGAGFNPELTGRENIWLYGALLGLTREEIAREMDAIIEFAEIGEHIDQPVHTYSSGMFVRLAFSVATAVRPDVLIIDEALSVGDGLFAQKSFKRIMALKEQGAAIIFCSHMLYQVEVLSDEVIWLHQGRIRAQGAPEAVVHAYSRFLESMQAKEKPSVERVPSAQSQPPAQSSAIRGHIRRVKVFCSESQDTCISEQSTLTIEVHYHYISTGPAPVLAVVIHDELLQPVSSCATSYDGVNLPCDAQGNGCLRLQLSRLPLLKGEYTISVYLMCENTILVIDQAEHVHTFRMTQRHPEIGRVLLPRRWMPVCPNSDNGHNSSAAICHN
ncbi:ABC transporter ATP-binding protein [Candidatus Parcubacteria bacterium]|nr:MAG: ABC transporter ATP-binding protein [Candidatus Parcubacteria bacterium]